MFSWSKLEHFESLLQISDVQQIEYDDNVEGEYPWLFKILITNFPAQPIETIKDLNYQNRITFTKEEFGELLQFLRSNKSKFDLSKLQRGSLFFIKLGQGKSQALDKHYQNDLKKGVECSLNMLKSLTTVILNEESIQKLTLKTIEFRIVKDSGAFQEIDPTDKKCDIKIIFGYLPYKRVGELKEYPNFYKYFPIGAEEHSLSFIIHCDAFKIETNRRELEEVPTNRAILSWFINEFISKLDGYIENQPEDFREVYAHLLISNEPSKSWLVESLYEPLLSYISSRIPTKKGNFYSQDRVGIKKTALSISPSDFGIKDKEWFYWDENRDKQLVEYAAKKLKLASWKIEDLVFEGSREYISNWVASTSNKTYVAFLRELNGINERRWKEDFIEKVCSFKIFKFTDGKLYSVNEIQLQNNYLLICSQEILAIKNLLATQLGFCLSTINLAEYQNLLDKIKHKLEGQLGGSLFARVAQKTKDIACNSSLKAKDKEKIFNFLKSLRVRPEILKKLILFKDSHQSLKPLGELLVRNIPNLPSWLQSYQINTEEYFSKLDEYLLQENKIYDELIYPNWEEIIQSVHSSNVKQFYQDVKHYFDSSQHKSSLTEYPYIYTTNGFKNIHQVFYSNYLGKVQSYVQLKVAIASLTNFLLPERSIIEYLSQPPFQTNPNKLEDMIAEESANLEQSAIENLIEFTTKNGESLFTFLYISSTSEAGIYSVVSKSNPDVCQYYTQKIKLKEYIESNLSEQLKIIPTELYNEKGNNKGLLTDAELYNNLLKTYFSEELIEDLIGVIKECGIKDVEKYFLQRIPLLTLRQGEAYRKTSYEYQVLELASQCIIDNESLREEFKKKVRVVDKQGVSYPVREALKDEVVFEIDGKTHELSLSEILPRYQATSGVVNKTLKQFKGLTTKLKNLFGVGETNISYEEVYEELKRDFAHLQNAHQLAFVVLYAKSKQDINLLKYFTVSTKYE